MFGPYLIDKICLRPSVEELPDQGKTRRMLPFGRRQLEVFTWQRHGAAADPADLFVLKFGGVETRAERSTDSPVEYWKDLKCELWAVNPPGYGRSEGRASLRNWASMADTAFEAISEAAAGRPIVVFGNSMGTTAAMYVAAKYSIAGLVLRNPVSLRHVIAARSAWWNAFVGAPILAPFAPRILNSLRNATFGSAPAVIITSGRDRVVPPHLQDLVVQSYGGEKRRLILARAGHSSPPRPEELVRYEELMLWLRGRMFAEQDQMMAADDADVAYRR